MPDAVIDACCLIDLMASGCAEEILRSIGFDWYLPQAVQDEIKYLRQHDPDNPGQTITVEADLTPLISAGVLVPCGPENQAELDRFTQYAVHFRSDGEAMCLALAESRGWIVATDDRKAIRIGQQAGQTVISCPQLVKTWADQTNPDESALLNVLREIQILAQFRPNPSMPEYQWWLDQLTKANP